MKKFIVFLGVFLFILTGMCIIENNNKLSTKTILYNGNNLRISIDGATSSTLPTSGNYYLANYDCKSDATIVTWDRSTYQLKVTNKNKRSGVSCYLDFQSNPKLSDMPDGSYVVYTGNNGCRGESCNGRNANYESEERMGYCNDITRQFITNGWRLAYSKYGSAYLISAGSTDCMCTGSDGIALSSGCRGYLSSDNMDMHFNNMNNIALKYCNMNFSYGGVCDENTAWAMNANDFQNIMGKTLSSSSCNGKYSDKTCGYTNDLIDNGGYYWFASYSSLSGNAFLCSPTGRVIEDYYSLAVGGVRPVLKLDPNVIVISGSGTYEDPYEIANNTFLINEAAVVEGEESNSLTLNMIGYNVSKMCVSLNTSGCSNYVNFSESYTLDLSTAIDGENIIYVYYKDSGDNIIASMHKSITLGNS